jgi:membrane protein
VADSELAQRADAVQRRNPVLAVAVATVKKFQEDRSTRLAAMIAFWAFFSVFPLFLLLVSLLGYFLPASMKSDVLHHVAGMFPLLDPSTVGHLSGSVWSAALGGLTALWSGTAVMRTTEFAFNSVWEIPMTERPKLVEQLRRAVKAVATIGAGLVVSTIISGFVTGQDTGVHLGLAGRVGGYLLAAALDVGLFLIAFRMLTDRQITFRDVLPGALLSGVVFFLLEQLSSFIIARHLNHAQATYGHFATVITILWWFYLQAVITLLGAQLNVVLYHRLHPRSLGAGGHTDADRRTLAAYAESRSYEPEEQVDTRLPGRRPGRRN